MISALTINKNFKSSAPLGNLKIRCIIKSVTMIIPGNKPGYSTRDS
jgi:hypothetical protein